MRRSWNRVEEAGNILVHSVRAKVFLVLGITCRTLNFTLEWTSLGWTLVQGGHKGSIDERKLKEEKCMWVWLKVVPDKKRGNGRKYVDNGNERAGERRRREQVSKWDSKQEAWSKPPECCLKWLPISETASRRHGQSIWVLSEEIAYFVSAFSFFVCDLALKWQECGSAALALWFINSIPSHQPIKQKHLCLLKRSTWRASFTSEVEREAGRYRKVIGASFLFTFVWIWACGGGGKGCERERPRGWSIRREKIKIMLVTCAGESGGENPVNVLGWVT